MNTYYLKRNYPTHDEALLYILELHAVLDDCATYFDNKSDVSDGEDGKSIPNEEMALLLQISKVL
jgi:hypothetical protein